MDERGWFSETYNRQGYVLLGVETTFCQDNHSLSRAAGVLRGLHFQCPPHAQAKLVRCVSGRIWDVAVDLRTGSPTYGKWAGAELNAENGFEIFIPVGFAHGFLTLEPDSEVEYKVSDYYAPRCEGGLIWNDPDVAAKWPHLAGSPILSAKDAVLPRLAELASPFVYDGTPMLPADRDLLEWAS
jgi:dTDP-4-dehydrorhamnose 3,5-epimerase